uniref:Protein krueppel n=1 Tax=Anopheles minimus TaxID=112268 RepID=A0A182WP74_9DIPT
MNYTKCRFCLEHQYSEAGSFSILNIPFNTALKRVFSFEIKPEPNLPDCACKTCSTMVWQFYTYSVLVEDNQHKLQQERMVLNAETSSNFANDYRMGEHTHVTVKSEPTDSDVVDGAPLNEHSYLHIKDEPQVDKCMPDETVLNRKVSSENDEADHMRMDLCNSGMAETSSNLANDYRMEDHTHVVVKNEPTDSDAVDEIPLNENSHLHIKNESQVDKCMPDETVLNRKVPSDNDGADHMRMEECALRTNVEECNSGMVEKFTLEQHPDDESTNNVEEFDKPHDMQIEPDDSSGSCSQGNAPVLIPTVSAVLLPCDQCDRTFPNKNQLRNHQRVHKFSECPICKKHIKGDFISQHLAAHEGAFRCDICDASFGCTANLRMHKDMKHAADAQPGDETFPCDYCERTFHNKTQLSFHRRLHKTKQCPICLKQVRSTHLQTHISVHQGAFYCDLCKRAFSSRNNLIKHKKAKHTVVELPAVSCDQCDLTFPNQAKLAAHRKVHLRKQCPICMKVFRPNKMKEHLASHDGAFGC